MCRAICSWGHKDSQCTGHRLGVSDLGGCRRLGACSELGICEGDLGKMQSREVGEWMQRGMLMGSAGSKWPCGALGRLTTHLELKTVPGGHFYVSGH